jgi:hypothetical protein
MFPKLVTCRQNPAVYRKYLGGKVVLIVQILSTQLRVANLARNWVNTNPKQLRPCWSAPWQAANSKATNHEVHVCTARPGK